jgi:hypothetical protein
MIDIIAADAAGKLALKRFPKVSDHALVLNVPVVICIMDAQPSVLQSLS